MLPHGVRFGAVELELGMDVGDRELKATDLGELVFIRDRRVEGVANVSSGCIVAILVGEVAADVVGFVGHGGGALKVHRGMVRRRDAHSAGVPGGASQEVGTYRLQR